MDDTTRQDLERYLTTDPDQLGFAKLIAQGDHVAIAQLLNTPNPKAPAVPISTEAARAAQALDVSDLRGMPAADLDVVRTVLGTPGEITNAQLLALVALFPAGSATAVALAALAERQPTYAELAGFMGTADYSHVGLVLGPLAHQEPSNPAPSREFSRFAVNGTRIYLPSLASGQIPDDTEVRFARDGLADQAIPFGLRGEAELPAELIEGASYYVTNFKAGSFELLDAPGGQRVAFTDGGGLIEFPGLTMKQVRR